MKLALKVVVAVIIGLSLVLALFGYVRVEREAELFDTDIRRDHESLGRTLHFGIAAAWEADGHAGVLELVDLADQGRPDLQIAWLYPDGRRSEPSRADVGGLEDRGAQDKLMTHHIVPGVTVGAEPWLISRLAVRVAGHYIGSVEIGESLAHRDAYIERSIRNTLLATATTIVSSSGMVLLLGLWLIARPLGRLAAKAQRVGDGDLTEPLVLPQRDEVGQLAREMNAMCERLAAAQERARSEASARSEAFEQLRHADRLATVGQLAAGIAHELGTPLNVVAGRAKMIHSGRASEDVARDYARIIAEQAERMTAIIRQLLDFARRRVPNRAPIDLSTVAISTSRLLAHLAEKSRVRLEVDPGQAPMMADASQLEQVLTNLVVNAIFASSEGGTVRIATGITDRAPAHDGGSWPEGARVAFIRVEDEGHGMDTGTKSRIFEPFFTTKDVGQGSGLGLSVAHGIVLEHGGFIRVESEPGRGSTFWVYLPAQP